MLTIVEVYQTSKGFFLTMEEASLNKNRAKEGDYRFGLSDGREKVMVRTALTDGSKYLLLEEIKIGT